MTVGILIQIILLTIMSIQLGFFIRALVLDRNLHSVIIILTFISAITVSCYIIAGIAYVIVNYINPIWNNPL